MLRITGHDERIDEWLRPIPFRRHARDLGEAKLDRFGRETEQRDPIQMAEAALDRVQKDLDELSRMARGPLPFPSNSDDDGPSAA